MDPLTQLLTQRAAAQQPTPSVPPSGGQTHTPPELQRYLTAQRMMQAYRQNWTPNPILTQISQGK